MILQFLVTVPAVDPEESVTCAVKKLNGSGVAGVPVDVAGARIQTRARKANSQ